MTPALDDLRRQRANALLGEALDVPAEDRQAFVEQACRDDPALLALLTALLGGLDRLGDFLEQPVHLGDHFKADTAAPVPQPGELIGHWRVVRELGRGGMGVVLLVERSDGVVQQRAALKIIQDGSASPALLERFHAERQILANLSHPDIARLIDAGSTDDGRPYFVMEYMDGVAIDRYCAQHRLSLDARIGLFMRVCQAVHYAHQHLVIHRDLKPANILVGQDGSLKLLDFGIATLLDGDGASDGAADAQPATGAESGAAPRLLTPLYASPEQLAGTPLSSASDLYSLGVILYRLLTGRSPYGSQAGSVSVALLLEQITRDTPALPSHAVTASASVVPPASSELPSDEVLRQGRRLARALRGDLDNILLKAIDRQPALRYASADAFAQDLQRYQTHQPIRATAPSWRYRGLKFVQRYPWGAAATAAAVLSLLAGTGVALWQAHEARAARIVAERHFEQTRQIARSMLFEINDSLEKGPTVAREKLLATALQYLKQLAPEPDLQPALRRDVASAYERIGDIVGNQTGDNLGRIAEAEGYYEQALQLRQAGMRVPLPHIGDLDGMREIHRRLGDLAWSQGRVADTVTNYNAATADARAVLNRTSSLAAEIEWMSRRRYGAAILYSRGQPNAGQLPQAIAAFAQLRQDLEAFIQRHPENADVLKVYVPVLSQSVDLYRVTGDLAAAHRTSLVSLALSDARLKASPDDPRWRRQRSITLRQIGDILIEQGHNAAAFVPLNEALAMRQAIAIADPANERAARDVAIGQSALADALMATEDYPDAQGQFMLARDTYTLQLEKNPANVALQSGWMELQFALAKAQLLMHRLPQAAQTLTELKKHIAALPTTVKLPPSDMAMLDARIILLDAQIAVQPPQSATKGPRNRTTGSKASYQAAEQAVARLVAASERDPLDTYLQRDSATAWKTLGEIGLAAGETASACRNLERAAARFSVLESGGRLNASDRRLRDRLGIVQKGCG